MSAKRSRNDPTAVIDPPVSPAAVRMRRHRDRRRRALRLVQVQLHETEVDALIESGWLEKRSRNDPNAVIDAVHRLFDRVFNRMRAQRREDSDR